MRPVIMIILKEHHNHSMHYKGKIKMNYIQSMSSYRAVNTLSLGCKYQSVNLLKPTGYVMHQQFNIQQLYALPTHYLCVLYLSENKQRLVPPTA